MSFARLASLLCLTLFSPAALSLEFDECEITDPTNTFSLQAECATFNVPQNPAEPTARQIELHIARIAATRRQSADDPLVFITGGPGQAASETFIGVRSAFDKVLRQRDIYLIDQRGTGRSTPITCENEALGALDPFVFDREQTVRVTQDCLDSLTVDPRFFTTSVAVRDLDAVRQELEVEQWNLYGVSYGTRVAQHYLRRYPEATRSVILDAVAPPMLPLGPDIALQAQSAIDRMADRCADDDACATAFPDLGENIDQLVASLRQNPRPVKFENFKTGQYEEMEFGPLHLGVSMRMLAYQAHGVAVLPTLLHSAYQHGNFAPLARQALNVSESLGQSISIGMHNSVICTEDVPFITEADVDRGALERTYLGPVLLDGLIDACSVWPAGLIDDDFRQPVESERPVLVLSGEADPITPPAYAEKILPTLPNARHIVVEAQGHMQAAVGCMPTLMAKFIEQADASSLNVQCLERQTPEPFFVNANGPAP